MRGSACSWRWYHLDDDGANLELFDEKSATFPNSGLRVPDEVDDARVGGFGDVGGGRCGRPAGVRMVDGEQLAARLFDLQESIQLFARVHPEAHRAIEVIRDRDHPAGPAVFAGDQPAGFLRSSQPDVGKHLLPMFDLDGQFLGQGWFNGPGERTPTWQPGPGRVRGWPAGRRLLRRGRQLSW